MPRSRIPSPARSQGGITPRRHKPRGSRSVCSPALSTASGRLTSVIDQFKEKNLDSFALSPVNSRQSVLSDNTDIEEPRRKSWWKNLNENSRDVMDMLEEDKATEANNAIEDIVDIEVLSQEKKNYTLDLPESSDNESINSIVLPQRRLFTQKDNQQQRKFGQLVGARETLAKLHKTSNTTQGDKSIVAHTKDLFQRTKRSKPIFPAALLNISPNKTAADKTKENVAAEPKLPVRNIFGNRPASKRKNMFADFIVSESEDDISEIQPKVFGFQKKVEQRRISAISKGREQSPTSSIITDVDLDDDWKHLPSSTMVDNQLDEMTAGQTPVKRARLSKLLEDKETVETMANKSLTSKSKSSPTAKDTSFNSSKTVDKTKQSDKSSSSKNKTRTSPRNKSTTKAEEQNNTNKSAIVSTSDRDPDVQEQDDDENNFTLEYENDDEVIDEQHDNNAGSKAQSNKLNNKTRTIIKNDKSKIDDKTTKEDNVTPNKTVNRSLRSNTFNKSQNNDNNKSLNTSKAKSASSDTNASDNAANTSRRSNKSLNKSVNKSTKTNNKSRNKSVESLNTSQKEKTRLSKATKTIEESQNSDQHTAQDNIDGVLQNEAPETSDVEENAEQEMDAQEQESGEHEAESNVEDQSSKEVEEQNSTKEDEEVQEEESQEVEAEQSEEINIDQEMEEDNQSKGEDEIQKVANNSKISNKTTNKLHEDDVDESSIKVNKSASHKADKSMKANDKTREETEDKVNVIQEKKNNLNRSKRESYKVGESDKRGDVDEANQSRKIENDNQVDENQAIESSGANHQSEVEDAAPNQSQEVNKSTEVEDNDGAIKSQELDDEEVNESQEVENDDEVDESQEEVEINESQEVENDDEVNESQEEVEVNESQEVADDDEVDESQEEVEVNESQEVEDDDEVNESQEVVDEVEANESQEIENNDEVGESEEVEDDEEVNESQEVEDEEQANESQEAENDAEVSESEEVEDDEQGNESQEVSDAAEESEVEEEEEETEEGNNSQEQVTDDEADASQEVKNEDDSANESQEVENNESVDQEMEDSGDDRAIATDDISENEQEEMEVDDDQNERTNEAETDNAQTEDVIDESPNVTHDTTGRNRKKIKSPEVILHDKTNQQHSFIAKGRNTSVRKTKSMYKDLNIRPSLAPARDSLGLSDGTKDSSAEGSGWDSHRTTRKTLRQTFGRDFTPRKSLRALVMEKSAKAQHVDTLHSETVKFPQANSTEYPDDTNGAEDVTVESDHEVSRRTRQTTLETYLQKIKQQNIEKKMKMEEAIRSSLKAPSTRDTLSLFKVPSKPPPRKLKPAANKPKKQIKSILFEELPSEVIEDMKYKPPKRFQPANASWITKRLYKFLESKLEPKYDYKARVRAEKLVETLYQFVKELRRAAAAPAHALLALKQELARLDVLRTHFEFYEFFHEFMPREVRVKVVPDIVNKLPLPRHGVFSDILRDNNVQG